MNKKARQAAEYVKKHGRYGDTEILHVNKAELAYLQEVTGIPLTINPDTGEPEAFLQFLLPLVGSTLAPTLFGTAVAPWMAAAIGSAAGSALAGGDMTDILTSAVTGGIGGIGGGAAGAADDFASIAGGTADALSGGLSSLSANPAQLLAQSAQAPTAAAASVAGSVPTPQFKPGTFGGMTAGVEAATPSFFDKLNTGFEAVGDRAMDIVTDPFAKNNIVPAMMGLTAIGDMFTPKPEGEEEYNPDDHPAQSYEPGQMKANRYQAAPDGYRPGIDPEFNYFPNFPKFADGGGVMPPATNNNLFQSFLSDPLQFGLISVLPKVMDALNGTRPGEIDEKSSMGSTEEDRQRALQGYTGFQPMSGNQMGARRFAKGGSVQATPSNQPQGNYGYTNGGNQQGVGSRNPMLAAMTGLPMKANRGNPRNGQGNNEDRPVPVPPRPTPTSAPDLSAWVPNMPGIESRAGFTPQQGPNWKAQLPFNYAAGDTRGPMTIMPVTPPTTTPNVPGTPTTPAPPVNPYPQLNPRQTSQLQSLLNRYNRKSDTSFNTTNYRDAPYYDKLQKRGFAEGGPVGPDLQAQSDQVVAATIDAIKSGGQDPRSQEVIQMFVQMFGPEALQDLAQRVSQSGGGPVPGQGGGMEDDVPASIDGQQPAALSSGEYVIPADVVAHLGDGNGGAGGKGSKVLDDMISRIRREKTGSTKQPAPLNTGKVLPI
jgi:hypothetical protein